jgi:uncharacterized membrane protein HdeD (DUF308 family)
MATTDLRQTISQSARSLGRWVGLRGVVTLAFGILFLARPGTGVEFLVALFAAYCFFDGFLAIGTAITGATLRSRGWLAVEGVLSIIAGVLTYAMPGTIAVIALYVIALRALIVGAMEAIAAIRLGDEIPNPWLLAIAGLTSMVFGVLLLRNPAGGLRAVVWLVGAYGVIYGATEILAAIGLRQMTKQGPPPLRPVPHA